MALESLAPDQRAVVQLVLQQGRSYADLAGLLGISEDAVRQRAHAGLSVLGADASVPAGDQGRITDYLLGQQDDAERAATLRLLETSPAALDWAEFVAEDLKPVARRGLPELPAAGTAVAEPDPEPVEVAPEPEREPELVEPEPEPEPEPAEPEPDPEAADAGPEAGAAPAEPTTRRERQRPRRDREREPAGTSRRRERQRPSRQRAEGAVAAADEPATGSERPSGRESSRLGGALLLAALALLVVVGVIYLFNRGEEEPSARNTTSTEASASPTATPAPIAQLPLRGVNGSDAEGLVQINAGPEQQIGFTLVARNMRTTKSGESAYATWLVGKGQPPLRLGFGEVLENQGGTLAVQGPEPKVDQATFTRGLTTYSQLIVSRETDGNVSEPSEPVLRGSLSALRQGQAEGGSGSGSGSGGN